MDFDVGDWRGFCFIGGIRERKLKGFEVSVEGYDENFQRCLLKTLLTSD